MVLLVKHLGCSTAECSQTDNEHGPSFFHKHYLRAAAPLCGIFVLTIVCSMMPRFHGGSDNAHPGQAPGQFTPLIPPYWSPENEFHYSFRAWTQDIQLWLMLTDLQEHQQAAAIVPRLGGAAP